MHHNLRQSDKWLWDREYTQLNAIPSSAREIPSKALQIFVEILKFYTFKNALDLGSGPGRNAIYLARNGCNVIAVDFCQPALIRALASIGASGLSHNVSVVNADLNSSFPFLEAQFDLVIDSYLSCHFLTDRVIAAFWSEMARVIHPSGVVFSTVFSVDDEYYQYSLRETSSQLPFVTDPANGITKRLYTEEEFKAIVRQHFEIQHFLRYEFLDTVLGRRYSRHLLIATAIPRQPVVQISR